MTTATQEETISSNAVAQLSARNNEPEWLLQRRLEAWGLFEEAPMPDPLSEEWKRVDTTALTLDGLAPFSPATGAIDSPSALPPELRSLWDESEHLAARIVQLDSEVVHATLDSALVGKGVVVSSLHAAAREHESLVREYLLSVVTAAEWKYLSLHGALWSGGCFVYVPRGVDVEFPIEYAVGITRPGSLALPHLLVVAEEDSAVTVVQEGASIETGGRNVVSGAVEVITRPGARVRFVDVQRWARNTQSFAAMRAPLERGSSFDAVLLGLGASLAKSRLDVVLKEDGAQARLSGLFFGDSDQRFYYDTLQDHIAPKTDSDLLFKAALTDRAAITWDGVVDVRKTAHGASANQTSRNLLLSDRASASPTPILEISAHDVAKCSHGATVGPVDQEQLFYLQSRGIPAEEAERMLIDGFFAEVLERVPSERLRGRIQRVLLEKLGR